MAKFGANILITGANRGIGLAFVRYLAKENEVKRIFAGSRNPQNAQDLQELEKLYPGKISSVQLDVQNDSSIESAYNHVKNVLKDEGLNLLINNAGILEWGGSSYENADRATFLRTFDVNTVSSVVVTKAFLPLLSKAAQKKERSVIVNISSGLASIKTTVGPYSRGAIGSNVVYGMSKAAMNYFNRAFGLVEAKNGIISVAVAPGWIQTDMGGSNASLTVDESIPEILKTVGNLKIGDSGRFVDRFGQDGGTNRKAWHYNGSFADTSNVGGYFEKFTEGLDFASVRGSGHFVPEDKPRESLQMIYNFINGLAYSTPMPFSTAPQPLLNATG